jgi:hypothetical protein
MVDGVLQDSVTNLRHEVTHTPFTINCAQHWSDLLRLLRAALLNGDEAKDDFRCLGGFDVLILVLRRAADSYKPKEDDGGTIVDLLSAVFELLSEALSDNIPNKRSFGKVADDFGDALLLTGILSDLGGQERAFGFLCALALLEDDVRGLFRQLRQQFGVC